MINRVGINKTTYCISCDQMIISHIDVSGSPMFGYNNPIEFPTIDNAKFYINNVAEECFRNGTYEYFQKYKYDICLVQVHTSSTYNTIDPTLNTMFKAYKKYSTPDGEQMFIKLIVHAVQNGFWSVGLSSTELVQELLDDVKYKSIIEDYIPMYVQENVEKFLNVGTIACNGADKGAIMLTSPDDLLERINFQK